MISKILGGIFRRLYKVEWVKSRLLADPYGHLFTAEGKIYMERYALIRVGTKASKVLKLVTAGRYDHVRMHHIMLPDGDRELHNHPFTYRTFILDGWYVESSEDGSWLLTAGDTKATKDSHFHRIAAVPRDGVTTLFCMGKDTGTWGFLVDGTFIESRDFFKLRRIAADGKAE